MWRRMLPAFRRLLLFLRKTKLFRPYPHADLTRSLIPSRTLARVLAHKYIYSTVRVVYIYYVSSIQCCLFNNKKKMFSGSMESPRKLMKAYDSVFLLSSTILIREESINAPSIALSDVDGACTRIFMYMICMPIPSYFVAYEDAVGRKMPTLITSTVAPSSLPFPMKSLFAYFFSYYLFKCQK